MRDLYPTEEELRHISDYDTVINGPQPLADFIKDIWWCPESGFKQNGELLELHTGGWSGNEDIIGALMDNAFFWLMCWQKSERGGHYYFDISSG